MNKKGFTLAEVLTVVVIIGLLFILVMPSIINSLRNKKNDIDNTTKTTILSAAELYVEENKEKFNKIDGQIDCLPLKTLCKEDYLNCPIKYTTNDKDITDIKSVKISYTNEYKYEIVNKSNCKVADKTPKAYKVGDQIKYKDELYYVIVPSDKAQDYVTLLKAEPLTYEEVNLYGQGEINKYTSQNPGQATKISTIYGGINYYNTETCGYVDEKYVYTGCKSDYQISNIKMVIDNWTVDKLDSNDLIQIEGYKTRLITKEELTALEYTDSEYIGPYSWAFSSKYEYWTMTSKSNIQAYSVLKSSKITYRNINTLTNAVRPVINLLKSAI